MIPKTIAGFTAAELARGIHVKFNQTHDRLGRFARSGGFRAPFGSESGGGGGKPVTQEDIDSKVVTRDKLYAWALDARNRGISEFKRWYPKEGMESDQEIHDRIYNPGNDMSMMTMAMAADTGKMQITYTVHPMHEGAKGQPEYQPETYGVTSRGELLANATPGKPTPKYKEQVLGIKDWQDLWLAKAMGMSLEGYRSKVTAKYKQLVDDALETGGVFTRIRPATLERVLADGRFKSQMETGRGTSKGTDRREHTEAMLYGTTRENTPDEQRPIYGFVTSDPKGRLNSRTLNGINKGENVSSDWLDGYGSVAVKVKPSVYDRTTITHGDSIDVSIGHSLPVPLKNPTHEGYMPVWPGSAWGTKEEVTKWSEQSTVKQWTAGDGQTYDPQHILKATKLDDYQFLNSSTGSWGVRGYVEAQFHGGLSAKDIEKVMFVKKPGASLRKSLDAAGIPWEVVEVGE